MSRGASWMSSYFYEKSWISSCCYIYPFFFGLTCFLFAFYKFLPSPFYLLVNAFLLAIGTIFCVQVLMRYSKPSAPKNEKNECIARNTSPYKLNLVRNDLRAKKLESFRFNPQVKSRRTFKGMKVRAVITEDNSSSSADGKAVEEDDGSQMGAPAVSSISWPTEDYMGRSRVEDQEQSIEEVAEDVVFVDEDAVKEELGDNTHSCLGSPWCLVDHQEAALDTEFDPVIVEEKPDGFAFSENPVVDDGSAEANEDENAHKEKDDGAQKEKDDGDKASSPSTTRATDVPRYPMNLGDSEQERNRRLESLIAKRKARKAMEKNLMDLDGMQGSESHCLLPFVTAPRRISHDFLYDFDDSIPGSAPSLLNPRKNPFDLPIYDLVDHDDGENLEHKDPVPVPIHRELFFTRHESFSIGAFMQDRRPSRFNFFLGEQKNQPLDSIDADVQRLLQEARASRISFSSESDSLSEISQGEKEDLPQENESPFELNLENTEQIESRMKTDTDHDTQVVKHFEAVQDDISEASVSSSLITFAEKAEVIDDKYENNSSTPSEEEKNISTTSTDEQVISGFCEDSRDLIAVASDAMNVNDQVYQNLLHQAPVHDCTLPEVENNIFKTSTHKQDIDGSCKEFMNSMAVESDAVNMDETDQLHQNLVHKELAHVSTSSEVENNNYKISTREEISDSCQDSMNLVAVNSVVSDAVNMDKADQVHQNLLVYEEHVQVLTSPGAKNNTCNTSTHVQEINGSCEDSMNSVAVESDTLGLDEQNLVREESVHVCVSLEAQNSTSTTSTQEQVTGGSCKDSMDSMVVNSDITNVDEADEVNQKIVVEPLHGSTSLEVENNNSKTSTHGQTIGSSCKDSMDSMDVDFDTVNVDKADQVCVHEEPVYVSTSPEVENNNSKTSTLEQEIGGSSKESMDSVAVDSDVVNIDQADRVHQNLNHEEPVHVSTSPEAENNNSKTSALEQEIGGSSKESMDTVAVDSDVVNIDQADRVHQNLNHEEPVHVSTSPEAENNNSKTSALEQEIGGSSKESMDSMYVDFDTVNVAKTEQVCHNLVHEEPVHVSTSPKAENNNSKTSTLEQEIGGSSKESMDSLAVDSDVVNIDKADRVHQNLNHEEPVHVSTSPEAENNNSKTSALEQEIGGSSKESMDSVAVDSDVVNIDQADRVHQNLNHEEPVHVSTSPEAENNNSKTSALEQEIGGSSKESMDSVAVDADVVNIDQADRVHQNLNHEEPVHVSTSPEAENNNSKTSALEQEIGGSSKESMDSVAVDSDTVNVAKTEQVCHNLVHEEPVHVSTSPKAENNNSKTSTLEQEIGGSSKESMDSVAVDFDVVNIDKADRVHQNLNHEEPVHVSTSPEAENNSLKTSTHDQVIGETCEVSMDSMAMDSAANVEEAAQVDDNDAATPTLVQTSSIADKGDSNDKEILLSGENESLPGEGSPLKAAAEGDISSGGRTDENESVTKETSETKDLDAAGNDVSRVQEDLGG